MLSWGTQCCQESTTVSVLGRVTNNHVTIDAQDANGKRRYNSAVLYRKQSGRLRPGLVTKLKSSADSKKHMKG